MRNPIAPLLADQIPIFIKEDYPNFHTLLKSFYNWLESENNYLHVLTGFLENQEVNAEVDQYIDVMLAELGWTYSGELATPKKLLVETLRDFYLSRGSKNSFLYLFRVLFDEQVFISYPRDRLFAASNAAYSKDSYILVSATSFGTDAYAAITSGVSTLGITIIGIKSATRLSANNISPIIINGSQYLQIMVNDIGTDFIPFETVRIETEDTYILETIYNCLSLIIKTPGQLYSVGDIITVTDSVINGTARVMSTTKGDITDINIIDGGTGYLIGDPVLAEEDITGHSFYGTVSDTGPVGEIISIKIWNAGYEYSSLPGIYAASSYGSDAILEPVSYSIGGIKSIEIIDQFWNIGSSATAGVTSVSGIEAIIIPDNTRCISNISSSYKNTNGFTEINCVLHDSNYFQIYSYELRSRVSRSRYLNVINEYVHPSGTICYSVYDNETIIGPFSLEAGATTISKILKFNFDTVQYSNPSALWIDNFGLIELESDSNTNIIENINILDRIKFDSTFIETIEPIADIQINNRVRRIYSALPVILTQEPI